jgi:serine/threonine-protein phosphatase 2A regulatory subunit B
LKSLEIEEKINRVRWVRRWPGSAAHTLLTTNDKTVKLWKVYEKRVACLSEFNVRNSGSAAPARAGGASPRALAAAAAAARGRPACPRRLPTVVSTESVMSSKCRRVFSSAHTYHINSVALASDQQTFLSADDLRINLWHLDRADTSFNVVDIKPSSMEDLTEVITCADFHPRHAHVFAYSSSKGCIRLADMRAAALCDQHAKLFEDAEPPGPRSFFSEIIASINDIKFVGAAGTQLLARDYMTLKLWDTRREAAPLAVYPVHDSLRARLCDLYENDCIFDKFDCCASGDGRHFATGTYSNFFRVVTPGGGGGGGGAEGGGGGAVEGGEAPSNSGAACAGAGPSSGALLEASRDPARRRLAAAGSKLPGRFAGFGRGGQRARAGAAAASPEEALASDFGAKVQHLAWHPSANVVATAASNSLYVFYGRPGKQQGGPGA